LVQNKFSKKYAELRRLRIGWSRPFCSVGYTWKRDRNEQVNAEENHKQKIIYSSVGLIFQYDVTVP